MAKTPLWRRELELEKSRYQEQRLKEQQAIERLMGVRDAYEQDTGLTMSEDQFAAMLNHYMQTGEIYTTTPAAPAPDDAPSIEGALAAPVIQQEQKESGGLADLLGAAVRNVVPEPLYDRVKDSLPADAVKSFAGSLLQGPIAAGLDRLEPDMSPTAVAKGSTNVLSPTNLLERYRDITIANEANEAREALETFAKEGRWPRFFEENYADPRAEVEARLRVERERAAAAAPFEKQAGDITYADGSINATSRNLRAQADEILKKVSAETQQASQSLSDAFSTDEFGPAAQALFSEEGGRAMVGSILPSAAAWAVDSLAGGAMFKRLGLSSGAAAPAAGLSSATSLAAMSAEDAKAMVDRMSDLEILQLPGAAEMAEQVGGVDNLRNALRQQASAATLSSNLGLENLIVHAVPGVFERVGAGVRGAATTPGRGAVSGAAREGITEFPQGYNEAIAQAQGEAAIGARDTADLREGALGAGALEGLAGAKVGGATGAVEAINTANRLDAILEDQIVGQAGIFNASVAAFNEGLRAKEEQVASKEDTELILDIAREQERIRNEEARTAAFEQAEAERAAAEQREAEQKELEEEAGFRTIERDRDNPIPERVERYGTVNLGPDEQPRAAVVERVRPAPAQEIRPEQVAEEREQAAREAREQQERVEQGQRIEFLRKRQEEAAKRAAKAKSEAEKKAEKERAAKERRIADEVIEEFPGYTPAQLEQEYLSRLNAPEVKPATKAKVEKTPEQELEAKVKSIMGRTRASRTRAEKSKHEAAIKAYLAKNPDATPEQVTQALGEQLLPASEKKVEAPAPKATAPSRPIGVTEDAPPPKVEVTEEGITDESVEALAGYFGRMVAADPPSLGMADRDGSASEQSGTMEPIDIEAFREQVRPIIQSLVRKPGKRARAVRDMIMQGKLWVVPNGASVGLRDGDLAHYDGKTNTMYLYADKLSGDNPAAAILRAYHEGTHAGTFNQREGRGARYRFFLGDARGTAAADKIRKAAENGNKLAQEAVRSAEEDTKARGGDNRYEDFEVIAYLANEAVEAREKPLGSVRGVIQDIVAGVRDVVREGLGFDLDFTIDDIVSAAANVGTEIAQTDLGNTIGGVPSLGMIVGEGHPRFAEMYAAGLTYMDNDGKPKAIISDEDSSLLIHEEAIGIWDEGGSVRVGDILANDALEGYPELLDIQIRVDPAIEDGASYSPPWNGEPAEILVAPDAVNDYVDGTDTRLHDFLLHEMQHAVQEVEAFAKGGSPELFITKADRAVLNNHNMLIREHNRLVNGSLKNVEELQTTPSVERAVSIARESYKKGDLTLSEFVEEVTDALESSPGRYTNRLAKELKALAGQLSNSLKAVDDINQRAWDAYRNMHGEQEAWFTQENRTLPQKYLPIMPDYVGQNTDVRLDYTIPPSLSMRDYEAAVLGPVEVTAYHGTNSQFDRFEQLSGEVGFHFGGNREQAEHRSRNGRIIEARLSFNNPIQMEDIFYWGGKDLVRELRRKGLVPDSTLQALDAAIQRAPEEAIASGERLSVQEAVAVADTLLNEGYDGIVYRNRGEGGGTAYIALSNDSISYPPPAREAVVLGMAAVDQAAGNYSPPNSPAFREWFGNSQIKEADGKPKVMYHGSEQQFHTFRTNAVGLIFASPSKKFADAFAGLDTFTLEQGSSMPLYVRAENVWDYDNPEHVATLLADPDAKAAMQDYYDNYLRSQYEEDAPMELALSRGDYDLIELPQSVRAIKAAGFDSLSVYERGVKNIAVFDPNQLKHAEQNNGQWSRYDNNIFAMRDKSEIRNSQRIVNRLPVNDQLLDSLHRSRVAATGLFRNDRGLGRTVLEAWEHAKTMPAAEEAKANASLGKYERALTRLATERGTTYDALNNEIMEALDAIDDQNNTYSENRQAWQDVLSQYGDAGRHMMDMRDQVDKMSEDMLVYQFNSGEELSSDEAKKFQTIANNMGRYTHRMYAAHLGKAGKKYAYATMKAWRDKKAGKNLSEPQRRAALVVEQAIETLIDDHLVIPADEVLWDMDAESVRRMYKTWGTRPTGNPDVEQMKIELSEMRDSINGDEDRINNVAEEIVKDLLGLLNEKSVTAVGQYYRGGKLNTGILQERKKIPVEIRTLMGEIVDPGTRMLATVAKQAEFVARSKMFHELKQKADSRDLQPPSATGTDIVRDNNMRRLEGPGYGSLEGWYASPNMHALLSDVQESMMTLEQAMFMAGTNPSALPMKMLTKAAKGWTGIAATSKGWQIVGNVFLYPLNLTGSWAMLASNGNYDPTTWARGLKDAGSLIRYARNPAAGLGSADLAVRYGVTDSATVGELKGLPYQKIQDFVNELSGMSNLRRGAGKLIKKYKFTATETYAMMDVWAKIANFHHEANQLRAFYEKNGETKTDDQIYREAADIVNATNISYKRALPLMKALERGGITHFGTYFYEVFRSQTHNAARGLYELKLASEAKTPEARSQMTKRGLSRLAGQTAFWLMAGAATKYLNELVFGDDEDDAWDVRSLFGDFAQNQDLIPFGLDENGVPVFFTISRTDPIGPMTDIMRSALVGEFNYDSAKQQLYDLYVKPRIMDQFRVALMASFSEETAYRDPLIKQLTPEGWEVIANVSRRAGVKDNVLNAWTNAAEAAFLPGTFTAYRNTNPVIDAPLDKSSGFKALEQASHVMRYLGGSFVKPDPDRQVNTTFRNYDERVTVNRRDIIAAFDNSPNMSKEDFISHVIPMLQDERKEWDKLHRVYRGMVASGMKSDDINKILKDRVGDKRVRSSLPKGQWQPISVSKRSIQTRMQNELKGKKGREKEEIEAKWKPILDIVGSSEGVTE